MITAASLAKEIRAYCRANADPENAKKWARYFAEGYDAWGLLDKEHPVWHSKRDEWLAKYASIGLDGFIDAGALLFESGKYEEGGLAINFLATSFPAIGPASFHRIGEWFHAGLRNWAHCDVLCSTVLSPALVSGRVKVKALEKWRVSPCKFQRRAVPVATIPLIATAGDVAPLLQLIRPLMLDKEKPVQQGLGWFLREAWKIHPGPVEELLYEFRESASRVIYQAATEKMTAAAKARFKRPAISSKR